MTEGSEGQEEAQLKTLRGRLADPHPDADVDDYTPMRRLAEWIKILMKERARAVAQLLRRSARTTYQSDGTTTTSRHRITISAEGERRSV